MTSDSERRLREKLGNFALLLLQATQAKELQDLRGQLATMQQEFGEVLSSLGTANEVHENDRQRYEKLIAQLKAQIGQREAELGASRESEARAHRAAAQARLEGDVIKREFGKLTARIYHLEDTLDWQRRGCPDALVIADDVTECPHCHEAFPLWIGSGNKYECRHCGEKFLANMEEVF